MSVLLDFREILRKVGMNELYELYQTSCGLCRVCYCAYVTFGTSLLIFYSTISLIRFALVLKKLFEIKIIVFSDKHIEFIPYNDCDKV